MEMVGRKVVLVSNDVQQLSVIFADLPSKRTLFIPTAAKAEEDQSWVREVRDSLISLGFELIDFDIDGVTTEACSAAMATVDIVYVGGGNTFYLLNAMNKCGFGDALASQPRLPYVGSSAGAVIAGSDISFVARIDEPEKVPGLLSTKGLGLIPLWPLPHANHESFRDGVAEIVREYGDAVHPFNDEQIIVVEGGIVTTFG